MPQIDPALSWTEFIRCLHLIHGHQCGSIPHRFDDQNQKDTVVPSNDPRRQGPRQGYHTWPRRSFGGDRDSPKAYFLGVNVSPISGVTHDFLLVSKIVGCKLFGKKTQVFSKVSQSFTQIGLCNVCISTDPWPDPSKG